MAEIDIEKAVSMIDVQGVEAGRFEAFCQLMHVLRSDNGCPWDRSQTMDSLKSSLTGELAEVLAGMELYHMTRDAGNLCEELGDLLMNFVLIADLAQTQGLFSMEDVIREAGRKMLRRHPHVFGKTARLGYDAGVLDEGEELPRTWDTIKAVEKRNHTVKQKELQKKALLNARNQIIDFMKSEED